MNVPSQFTDGVNNTPAVDAQKEVLSPFEEEMEKDLSNCFFNDSEFATNATYKQGTATATVAGIFDSAPSQRLVDDMLLTVNNILFYFPKRVLSLPVKKGDSLIVKNITYSVEQFYSEFDIMYLVLHKGKSL